MNNRAQPIHIRRVSKGLYEAFQFKNFNPESGKQHQLQQMLRAKGHNPAEAVGNLVIEHYNTCGVTVEDSE